MLKKVDVLLIALTSPIQIGIYENQKCIETIHSEEHSSEILPTLFENILERYDIQHLIYTNGPGSFMAIKVSYIFLKTLCIVKNIPLLAADAFEFNGNIPIKAVGKLCFVKNSDTITTQIFPEVPSSSFILPQHIDINKFSTETAPFYGIGAVG